MLLKIMTLKITNEIWEFLKQEYARNEKFKGMQALNFM